MAGLALRIVAGPGCTVFAVDDGDRPLPTGRKIPHAPDYVTVPAILTADNRVIAKSQFYRAGLASGDLQEIE